MAFTPFEFMRGLFSNSNNYDKTNKIPSVNYILNGQPQFLNPDTWNAYNIFCTTPQLYAVINRLGHLQASGKWKHYKADKSGNPVLIEDSEVIRLLENPNPLMDGNSHIIQHVENLSIYGNNYEYVLRAFKSQDIPSGLTNINPTDIGIQVTGKLYKQSKIEDIISYYEIESDNNKERLEPKEINHTKINVGKNLVKGDSPMRPIYMPISNIRSAYQFRNVIMNKRGALGILSNNSKDEYSGIPLDNTERKRIEEQYQSTYGIGDSQNQIIMSSASLGWQAMSFPTKDLLLFEEVESNFKTIIDHYGLNDNLFSKDKASTFTNMAEGLAQAYQSTIIPQGETLASDYSKLFNLPSKGEWLERDFSHIEVLQENEKEKSETLEKKANAMAKLKELGLYSDEDLKEIIGLD